MSAPSGIVTLLTDFGTRDPFAGIMHGVMLSIEPGLRIVDLSHGIEPQAVADAAFWLEQSYRWFPAGSVHVAVVDPGVGSERAAVAVRANGHYFVGPDNGSFELVVRRAGAYEAREIDPARLGLTVPSRTFHGRDVFAPVAARLAAGHLALGELGPARALLATAHVPEAVADEHGANGSVVVVDRFGNVVTNVPEALVREGARIEFAGQNVPFVRTYAEVPCGTVGAVIGSCGTLELFVRDGSARDVLGAKRGDPVRVSVSKRA